MVMRYIFFGAILMQKHTTSTKKTTKKVTSIGGSAFTRYNSKNDKANKKKYRAQGR
jgi:hypothetical protein